MQQVYTTPSSPSIKFNLTGRPKPLVFASPHLGPPWRVDSGSLVRRLWGCFGWSWSNVVPFQAKLKTDPTIAKAVFVRLLFYIDVVASNRTCGALASHFAE
jgi:hypothetical protein